MRARTPLDVKVFSDYICPFCYIGSERLFKLSDEFDLEVEWLYFEIHPDTPPEGMPVERLGYDPEHWRRLMASLQTMAIEEGITIAERTFTTNSHKAMLLAEAVRQTSPEQFPCLHDRLFEAFFVERLNIGDEATLRELASGCGVDEDIIEHAWLDHHYEAKLHHYSTLAARLHVSGVPTYVLGNLLVPGATSVDRLRAAAHQAMQQRAAAGGRQST